MADGTTLNAMSGGDVIFDDDITDGGVANGKKVQGVKAMFGPHNGATLVDVGAGMPTQGMYTRFTTPGVTGGNALVMPSTDLTGYRWYSIQLFNPGNANTFQFECCNDNTNWKALYTQILGGTDKLIYYSAANGDVICGPVNFRYMRIRISSYSSGTCNAMVELSGQPSQLNVTAVQAASGASFTVSGTVTADTELPAAAAMSDTLANPTTAQVAAANLLHNGATWERQRGPTKFGSMAVSTGSAQTAWTPTSGKKWRLLRFCVQLLGNSSISSAGNLGVYFYDGSSPIWGGQAVTMFYLPTSATNYGAQMSPWFDLGNGVLSALANNVMAISTNVALTNGAVNVFYALTEE